MSSVPSLAALDHTHLKWDKEWMFHKLPKDNIEIPRHHLPDPEAEAIPGTNKPVWPPSIAFGWYSAAVAVTAIKVAEMDTAVKYAKNHTLGIT
ncbi:hypothetical protein Q1695_012204 [Nippostrongylus brasiliensis]|nr:hypothetical protein Q1695_012204 [Nippostrongylus brasiliensis]